MLVTWLLLTLAKTVILSSIATALLQRRNPATSSSIDLDESLIMHMDNSDLLSNTKNQENFVEKARMPLGEKGHTLMYAVADVDIVTCVINRLDSKDFLTVDG